MFLGINLSHNPSIVLGVTIAVPVVAGLSSYLLCVAQNKSNVLQAEQSKVNQWGMLILSVGLSLYLGFFVPAGIALYWVASNLLAIVQLYALNAVIPPKKYVDYEALEESRKELAELQNLGGKKKLFQKMKIISVKSRITNAFSASETSIWCFIPSVVGFTIL